MLDRRGACFDFSLRERSGRGKTQDAINDIPHVERAPSAQSKHAREQYSFAPIPVDPVR
jgi:hypothetical protein